MTLGERLSAFVRPCVDTMYVIVDLGYLLFYRYHASMRWLDFQKELEEEMTEEYIANVFRKHLIGQLQKLQKKYPMAKFLFCKDEKHCDVWRKAIYPEYKATRGEATDRIRSIRDVMFEIVQGIGKVFEGRGLEADDVAFLLVRKLRAERPNDEIIIITSDRDYLQMTDAKVQIVDGAGKRVVGSGDAKKDLWIKIIMGDKSDNIPAIAKGCGKKTAETLAENPAKLAEFVKKHKCQAELDRNHLLVSMDKIPHDLQTAFYAQCSLG